MKRRPVEEQRLDTLRGTLETFGLAGIVRFVSVSGRTGVLKVESFRIKGRVYLAEGAITYATTRGEDGNVEDLEKMTMPGVRRPSRERRGRKAPTALSGIEDLVEQQVVEVFVRLMRIDRGSFGFEEGARTSAYGSGSTLAMSVDKVIAQAEERITEWEAIESLVPSVSTRFELNPDLGSDEFEVTLDARSWTFLAAIGSGASVGDLAEHLKIFEFPAAGRVAEFVRRGLLRPVDARTDTPSPQAETAETGHRGDSVDADEPDAVASTDPATPHLDSPHHDA